MHDPVSPKQVAAELTELWSPRVIGEVDDTYVKVAKVHGSLAWHSHEDEDELFLVLEGDHVFTVGETEHEAGPGDVVFAPRGIPHAQKRVVPRAGRTLTMASPAGFEGFFRELSAAEADGSIGPEVYARVSAKYGITWL